MDTLANGWVGSTEVIMVWAWLHWPMGGLVGGSMDIIMVLAWAASQSEHDADLSDKECGVHEVDRP